MAFRLATDLTAYPTRRYLLSGWSRQEPSMSELTHIVEIDYVSWYAATACFRRVDLAAGPRRELQSALESREAFT